MDHQPIDSSAIASAGYDDDRGALEVKFRSGRVYLYKQVPRGVYEELITSSSAGRYLNEAIRANYEVELIYDPHRPRVL